MRAEYRKEWMDTYLWVPAEKPESEEYIEKMLLYNPGEGRLEFSKQQEEGQEYYCYKVTGKKALNGIYAMMPIGERQIRQILGQIFDTLEKGREYLLCEEDFVLLPNYIFATLPKMEIELCYVPGYRVSLKEQLEGFFEYLLNRVDYDDKRAVELLYDCYMFCVKEQGGLAEIKERINRECGQGELLPEKGLSERALPEKGLPERAAVFLPGQPEPSAKEVPEPAAKAEKLFPAYEKEGRHIREPLKKEPQHKKSTEEKESATSYVSWLTERFLRRRKREALFVAEEPEEYHAERKSERPEKAPVPAVPQELMERTVLLSVPKTKEEPQLTNEKTGEVIFLAKLPFYIGSVEKYADYVLKEEGVSRIHCCISEKGERYYLADLNSTNGTFLDGKEILPGVEEELFTGACIKIAKTEFYVKLPCH